MTDEMLRLECLRMSHTVSPNGSLFVDVGLAESYYAFIKSGKNAEDKARAIESSVTAG